MRKIASVHERSLVGQEDSVHDRSLVGEEDIVYHMSLGAIAGGLKSIHAFVNQEVCLEVVSRPDEPILCVIQHILNQKLDMVIPAP